MLHVLASLHPFWPGLEPLYNIMWNYSGIQGILKHFIKHDKFVVMSIIVYPMAMYLIKYVCVCVCMHGLMVPAYTQDPIVKLKSSSYADRYEHQTLFFLILVKSYLAYPSHLG